MKSLQSMIIVAAASIIVATLVGCATPLKPNQVRVTYKSQPPGAVIYQGGEAWGTTPFESVLSANANSVVAGYMQNNLEAVWPSGARSRQVVRINLGQGDRQVTFSRPTNAPNLDLDLLTPREREQRKEEAQRMVVIESQCDKYGFRRDTDQFSQCLFRLDQAEKQRKTAKDAEFAAKMSGIIEKTFTPTPLPKNTTCHNMGGGIITCDTF